ncbi:hypothetical protein RD110_05500 [Rhodoferax koreense]|uniref:Uncharacterized protein n=1 Tax=Rhodoferax koreensis TaxID=1842727 RepID=A0A1P8JSL6_9BURK|nr:hypothetical protein [Rhodoferax koreense]APW36711.1 hypothetical protein RD110_05500 [Rhodoferax koreense]
MPAWASLDAQARRPASRRLMPGGNGGTAAPTYANGRGGTSLESDFLARGAGCRLEYRGSFRAGVITYVEGALRIDFRHAHGGRCCRFFIELPDEAAWESATRTPLVRRDDIVDFVAETVRREEAGSWRYEIEPTRIRYD